MDRIIYHFIAFGQLLLFVGWNVWIFLFVCFLDAIFENHGADLPRKFILYPAVAIVLIYVWIVAATGRLGKIRWWPSRDRLSRLVPPSVKSMAMTKCRWSFFIIDLEWSDEWSSSYPATSESSSSSGPIHSPQLTCWPKSVSVFHPFSDLHGYLHVFFLRCPRNIQPQSSR